MIIIDTEYEVKIRVVQYGNCDFLDNILDSDRGGRVFAVVLYFPVHQRTAVRQHEKGVQ